MKSMLTLAVATILVLLVMGNASAQMVDIGTGRMEKAEFLALGAMVRGEVVASQPVMPTPLKETERYGWIALPRDEFEALRDRIAGIHPTGEPTVGAARPAAMVDIGTGAMPREEFIALKQKVAGHRLRLVEWVAATYP